jgi:CheY-like chemotaxis protein
VGIAPEDIQRIFEPFTKIDRSAKHQGGTGLGLTISKRFVELHGGRMWVESAPGKGSTFAFTLPVVPPPPDAPMQGTLRDVRRQELGAVMVVERNPLLSRLLAHRLEGIRVRRVASTDDLWALPDEDLPEVVILNQPAGAPCDWRPQGPRVARWQRLPVMLCHLPDMLSLPARAGEDAKPHDESAGRAPDAPQPLRRFLIKPIAREQLYEVLCEMLRTRGPNSPGRDGAETSDLGATRHRRPARILIVEDDEDALHLLGRMLRSAPETFHCGYDAVIPVEMRSGEQAIEYLRELAQPQTQSQTAEAGHTPREPTTTLPPIDGILLDLKLSGVHGYEVLAELDRHEVLRPTPVCIVSGQELSGEALTSPSLTLARGTGLTARDLTQAIAALMQIALPGVSVTLRASEVIGDSEILVE